MHAESNPSNFIYNTVRQDTITLPAKKTSFHKLILHDLRLNWRLLFIILIPLILCPIVIISRTPAASCAYVVLMIVLFWLTEVLPLAVTALLPLALFPLFGILEAKAVATEYLKDNNWIFFGSLMMALAVEQSQLHHRVGLLILIRIGSSPRRLMLGFMISTCFLSMWMSNTATTAMMVPLALAVVEELMEIKPAVDKIEENINNPVYILKPIEPTKRISSPEDDIETGSLHDYASIAQAIKSHASPRFQRMCKGLLLSICYAANIGGTGTLTGTSTNLVLVGQLNSLYGSKDTGVTFATWMAFAFPQMVIILIIAWVWLQFIYIGFKKTTKNNENGNGAVEAVLRRKYKALKPMTFAEVATLILFILLISLWLLRKPGFMPGWGDFFPNGYVTDGTAAMIIALLLFIVPKECPKLAICAGNTRSNGTSPEPLLTWNTMQKEFTWGIVLLVGGGYALAAGVQKSGLDQWISHGLAKLDTMPAFLFVTISVVMITFLTEFTSNVAIASIFIPIGAAVAEHMNINPLYVVLPITIAASFAFMLPVATPPNAIVFGAGLLHVIDMASAGFVMNIICMLILLININTYGCWLFSCHTYPSWAEHGVNVSSMISHHNHTR